MTHLFKAFLFYAASAIAAVSQPVDPETGGAQLKQFAEESRAKAAQLSFEEFRAQTLFIEELGKFYVNGDTPILNEKLLREFWELNIQTSPTDCGEAVCEFSVITVGGLDQIWSQAARHALSYCVSTAFGSRHASVVADMAAASASWSAVADLNFVYTPTEDQDCNAHNTRVLFDVRPVNAGGQFLAAAFFPNDPRAKRSLVIDPSSFQLDPNGNLTLRGILRHELGHTIGGRHEHTRPEAGTCFEDANWRGVTNYDAFSVMHYPQCNGLGDWTLSLTARDQNGIACLYGAAVGFTIDTSICRPTTGNLAATQSFGPFDIAADDFIQIGDFPVVPGSRFRAEMTGDGDAPGDPDLYVKLVSPVGIASYDCRPFSTGAEEICDFDVPAGKGVARVAVHGYSTGRFEVTVTSVSP